ncbi:MAG: nicotinamide-nucleotide adenylyltransferase [Candidatus Micrarchaeota archaeon]|nr:nicotinamide-nucleotide adenylyltransferase [Candidatus Micrarchaeota archaeon]
MALSRTGLFIGRFQPLHKGHMHAIRFCLERCDRLVIGIGSSQESGTGNNPLTSTDRIRILKAGLSSSGIDLKRISFLKIPDFNDNDRWFRYITRRHKGIDVVFSRNRLVLRIFKEHQIKAAMPPWHERRMLVATRIREMIKKGLRWQPLVPRGAVKLISSHDGEIINARRSKSPKKG